jgi:uncharacterized protein (TIGR04255 family)
MRTLPTRLASEPIVEVVSEVRFDADGDAAVNLLPGILHEKFGPFDQQGRTFPAGLPPELLITDPSLAFRPHVAMSRGNRFIQVGPKVVSVALRSPYPGWTDFSAFTCEVFDVVCAQSFITRFDWVSLKYLDVISFGEETPMLSWLNADVALGGAKVDQQSCALRVEYVDGQITTVVQVSSPIQAQQPGQSIVTGLLIDVDTIHQEQFADFSGQYRNVLEQLHDRNKKQFFSLLTDETVSRLGPDYT